MSLTLTIALALGTIGSIGTPKVVPEWGSVEHFYYRVQDCPRSQRGADGWVGCSRLLVQFGAVRIVADNEPETPPNAPPISSQSFVPHQHPDGPTVVFTLYPDSCKPIPNDKRGLWLCVAPKGKPFSIGWRPKTMEPIETKEVTENGQNAPAGALAKPLK